MTPTFSYSKVYQSKAFDSEIHSAVMELKKELVRKINEGNLIDLNGQKSVKLDAYKLMQSFTVDGKAKRQQMFFGQKLITQAFFFSSHLTDIVRFGREGL